MFQITVTKKDTKFNKSAVLATTYSHPFFLTAFFAMIMMPRFGA